MTTPPLPPPPDAGETPETPAPCPWCPDGGKPAVVIEVPGFSVECGVCRAAGPITQKIDDAIPAWNRRRLSASEAVLRECEWTARHPSEAAGYCPTCGGFRGVGHAPDCRLMLALSPASPPDPAPAEGGGA